MHAQWLSIQSDRGIPARASSRDRTDDLPMTKRVHGHHALEAEGPGADQWPRPDSNRHPSAQEAAARPVAPRGRDASRSRTDPSGVAAHRLATRPSHRRSRPSRSRTGRPGFGGPAENPSLEQSGRLDSNQRPPASKAGALPTAPLPDVITRGIERTGEGSRTPTSGLEGRRARR